MRHARLSRVLIAALLFASLAVLHTWPLATAPARLSRNDNADTMLNTWIVAWVAHTLPRDPWHLFDANIFYPERGTLAFSEPLVVPGAMAIPLIEAGASPVLAYNLLLLLGFVLTGWTTSLIVERWTGDWMAGLVAGSAMAFNAHLLTRLPHLQAIHAEFLPLALFALDRLIARARFSDALLLAIAVSLQGFTSTYLLVFTCAALAVGLLVRPGAWLGPRGWPVMTKLAVAAGAVAVMLSPVLWAYAFADRHQQLERGLDEVALYSASWRDYLTTPGTFHYRLWSHVFFDGRTSLFPGVVAVALAAASLTSGGRFSDPRLRWCIAFGLVGVALSFGPALPGYATLYALITPLRGIRNAARFGWLTLAAVAIAAGYGVAALRRRSNRRTGLTLALLALALVNLEAVRLPIAYRPFHQVPSIYALVAADPNAVVVEFPLYPPDDGIFGNATYMLNSTRHFRPLVNGYSGVVPASYGAHYDDLRGFPDARSIGALGALGVTHVFVHLSELADRRGRQPVEAIQTVRELELLGEQEGIRLYRVRRGESNR